MSSNQNELHMLGVIIVAVVSAVFVKYSIHKIDEGHVGIYYRGGALLNAISYPGYHFMIPFITNWMPVQITLQTDQVRNVPCGTSGGVVVYFDRIEVVNILQRNSVHEIVRNYTVDYDKPLIFDKIHHELNQFCSKNSLTDVYIDKFDQIDDFLTIALQSSLEILAPGLTILSVRVTKPIIPDVIKNNYISMEAEKTKLLIAQQHQLVVEREAQTDKNRAIIEAQKSSEVNQILMQQKIMERESQKKMQVIEDETNFNRRKMETDAQFYEISKLAEANKILLTPEYLDKLKIEAISKLNKVYYGDKIPNMFLSSDLLKTTDKNIKN